VEPAEIESLERATVAAVAPPEVVEIAGWLAPFDNGSIGRAKCAAPLRHDATPEAIPEIFAAYAARGLPPAFRIAEVEGLDAVRAELGRRGLVGQTPTVIMVAPAEQVADFAVPFADLLEAPDAAWGQVFLGAGFDPIDGAHRVAALTRSPDALYGAVRESSQTVAVGVVSFGYGWAGVHGMRTVMERRGGGAASRLLALFGSAALARGARRIYLQVVESNPARNLYARAGFEPAWTYRYWA
jgi:N-acetylglutamate synthase